MLIIEVFGWIGAILIALAYFLLVHHDLSSRSKPYQWMNLLGAALLGINTFANSAYPSFTINIVWIFIAIYGLIKGIKR